jgi:hypothetical protein
MLSLWWFEDQPPAAYSEAMSVGRVHDSPAVVHRLQAVYDLVPILRGPGGPVPLAKA